MAFMKLRFLFLLSVVALAGCAGTPFETKRVDYKSEAVVPAATLETPPDLTPVTGDEHFEVPGRATTLTDYNKNRPGATAAAAATTASGPVVPSTSGKVRLERDGAVRWLVVQGTPAQLWPQLKDFWVKNGFTLKVDDPQLGVLETEWNENRANLPQDFIRKYLGKVLDSVYETSLRDKYRTRVEAGAEAGTTNIYITHKGMQEISQGSELNAKVLWQPRPSDPELENEFIRRMAVSFGVEQGQAQSLVASSDAGKPTEANRTQVSPGADGDPVLTLKEPFDRAWRRVGLALDRGGFTVEDRDRVEGVYYVRYTDTDNPIAPKDTGFLSKLAFWKSEDKSVLTQTYRLRVVANSDNQTTNVTVRDKDKKLVPPALAQRLLELVGQKMP
jgi:outer membrane protein assembly factor BamC